MHVGLIPSMPSTRSYAIELLTSKSSASITCGIGPYIRGRMNSTSRSASVAFPARWVITLP